MLAAAAALILANTGWGSAIDDFWETELVLIEVGDFHLQESLRYWVNDGLMAIFFFVVGLEIKREVTAGELSEFRRAALPIAAAIGGMIVPAAVYVAITAGGPGIDGWGVPMATDIAFAVGLLALLSSRVPDALRIFVLAVAIVDDIGAILVIALFYTDAITLGWLALGLALIALVVALRTARVWYVPVYVVVGIAIWVCFLESGVHATIAGVVLGLLTPARPLRPDATQFEVAPGTSFATLRELVFEAKETLPVAERLQHALHPWSAFIILPLFAFANAGIALDGDALSDALGSSVVFGVVAGLVIGKPLGIVAVSWLAVRSGVAVLDAELNWRLIWGAACLAGIGFTMSLFIAGLAFSDPALLEQAKLGIVAGSLLAALLGTAALLRRSPAERAAPGTA